MSDYGKWIRSLALTDPDLTPAHAWRRRFVELAHWFEMDRQVRDDLMGYIDPLDNKRLGLPSAATLAREISKLPRYEVG